MPRRRRGAGASADAERGLAMRILLHSPKDMIAGVLAFAAVSAIITNALFLQAGRHPSPMFGSVVALSATGSVSASPLPRPRPVDAMTRSAEPSPADPKPAEPKVPDPLANLVKSSSAPAVAPSNTAQAAGQRRVAAVQQLREGTPNTSPWLTINQASHGTSHFGGMGRDHEVRGASNRQEGGPLDVGAEQLIGALHRRVACPASEHQGRDFNRSEGRL